MSPLEYRKIKVGKGVIHALVFRFQTKNLVVLRGEKGYVMCGYLNMRAAEKFRDVAVKIVGVSTIEGALKGRVFSCTRQAKKLGISSGQPIRRVLRIIV